MKLDITQALISAEKVNALKGKVEEAQVALEQGTCAGNDFLGWLHLPSSITTEFIAEIQQVADTLRKECDTVVVAGIGGSYLGARAIIEALANSFQWLTNKGENPDVLFAGNNIGEDYLYELTEYLKGRKFGVINISKSGTTTETALAFRLLKKQCEEQRGKDVAKKVIVAITDAKRGAARTCADKEGYKSFIIPDNVGGRFSVLTPVGLLPIAIAGFDIAALVKGAQDMEKQTAVGVPFEENPAAQYAAVRNALYQTGKKIEIVANYQPKLHYIGEWWKQLYGESEGKDGIGIFPASVEYTADLHSMGQYVQEGVRMLFESIVRFDQSLRSYPIPFEESNADGLNYVAGRDMSDVSSVAADAVKAAHISGGVPNIQINVPKRDEAGFASLVCFFEMACGISGYISGVNPFNQPGVEAYKKNMFRMLGKPGAV